MNRNKPGGSITHHNFERRYARVSPGKATVALTLCLMVIISLSGCTAQTESPSHGNSISSGAVKISDVQMNETESSYRVEAEFPPTSFSSVGQMLADKIAREWEEYDGMTDFEKMVSSHLWGCISFETGTWQEFEEALGCTVENPLEALEWLNPTGYSGMESADPGMPIKHVTVRADTANAERKLKEISADSGYQTGKAAITLTATLSSREGTYSIGYVASGRAEYEKKNAITGSGIPVLIVTTVRANNTGYYSDDFYAPTAYWVKENVFYSLRVMGDSADKTEIQATLDRILAEI